jgi:hypothetical protein
MSAGGARCDPEDEAALIRFEVDRPHGYPLDEARERLRRLIERIAAAYSGYDVRHEWLGEARTAVRFRFEKAGRGRGEGTATIVEGRVAVEVTARFHLPFFVPVALATRKARQEVEKALEGAFG